jgi:TRAP transporter TAXI family solute receptor
MNKTVVAVVAVFTAGAVALWALGGGRDGERPPVEDQGSVVIGTGVVTGLYFPAGGAVCRLLNRGRDLHGLRCSVESTDGSVANINGLRGGELDLAVVQSDWQDFALNGSGSFKAVGPYEDLRALFSLHGEAFNVFVRRDAEVKTFADLKGKRINVGAANGGVRAMFEDVMAAYGMTAKDFAQVAELRPNEQIKALCDKKIDAAVYVVAHPNGLVQDAAAACDLALVEIAGPPLARLLAEHPYYAPIDVPPDMYPRLPQRTRSFGLRAVLVAPAQLGDDVVYQITRAVFDNFEEFRGLHPAFAALEPKRMTHDGITAPLHAGAERYFRDRGLL